MAKRKPPALAEVPANDFCRRFGGATRPFGAPLAGPKPAAVEVSPDGAKA